MTDVAITAARRTAASGIEGGGAGIAPSLQH